MTDTKDAVRVIFKVIRGEVEAFILDEKGHIVDVNPGDILCYAHIGQHSSASLDYYHLGKPAKPEEYADLKAELESIGYDVKVARRIQYNHTK